MTLEDDTRHTRVTSFGWMIQRIAGALDREMEHRLAAHDLTLPQFAILMTVLETDGLSQAEIGQRFGYPAYTVSRALDHLETNGQVVRRPNPTSRRALTIHATESGRTLAPALFAIVREVNAQLTTGLTETERASFGDLLLKVLHAQNSDEPHPSQDFTRR